MSILVACISSGKGTWVPVLQLMKAAAWERIFVITTPYFSDKLPSFETQVKVIVTDDRKTVQAMSQEIAGQLDISFAGDVAVNMFSGGGKEHMALLSALLKTGSGIRFVSIDETGLVEL